jgi:hypothetical protein
MFFKKKKPAAPKLTVEQENEIYLGRLSENKGNKLVDALKIAIGALEKDIVHYEWASQGECNCGVIVQAMLGVDSRTTKAIFTHTRQIAGLLIQDAKGNKTNNTWRELCQRTCTITGMPTKTIFKILHALGLTAADIVHLEYLNNTGILAKADIDVSDREYYKKPKNLIKYLKAWLRILEGKSTHDGLTEKEELEVQLLIAVNSENYERAKVLKEQLVLI